MLLRLSAITFSFVLSFIIVALVLHLSHKKSWYDKIDERKIHTGDVPRLGGIGFASAFIMVTFIIAFLAPEEYFGLRFFPPLIAMVLVLVFGVLDDFRPLAPRYKLLVQIIAGFCVIIPDYTFHRLVFFNLDALSELRWLRYPVSFLWIVGLTNAVNFIDGVDGLAGGISVLISLAYALIFASSSTGSVTLLCICLAAAIGGFLIFNMPFPRAKIFMGDGGSQFLGFILALLPLITGGDARMVLPLPYAAALLIIPIFDTIAAVWRRTRDGRRIDSPDKFHIHHKLMNLGLDAQKVDGILYGLQLVLGLLVFISVKLSGGLSLIVLGITYLLGIAFFVTIHYMNRAAMIQRKFIQEQQAG
ncbi:MAG: undecaprenyl/decaprenyl-phosphate alpha-N-acetylglucosaminyl 1-phosphate transferase [Spirochaetaceae bacterium]|jgi:UDP-GlcNAc:undecaprenyl-phosphate GlcNAc-1-phosphate transferase|nr:undecaprenyl/decaprenyl-phosphate alpha-N-acetylglucosaminyl 1-phosphate transferase [Spirochaetaceae bacterium]